MATGYESGEDNKNESHGVIKCLKHEDLGDDPERREVLQSAWSGRSAPARHIGEKERGVLSLAVHGEEWWSRAESGGVISGRLQSNIRPRAKYCRVSICVPMRQFTRATSELPRLLYTQSCFPRSHLTPVSLTAYFPQQWRKQ